MPTIMEQGIVPAAENVSTAGQFAQQAQSPENSNFDMNVQNPVQASAELIDDVSNGEVSNQNQQPLENNIRAAREKFMSMLSDTNDDTTQNEMVMNTDGAQVVEQMPMDHNNPMETTQQNFTPSFNMDEISSRIEAAVQNAVRNGQLQDLSSNDIVASVEDHNKMGGDEDEKDIELPDIESEEFFDKFTENPGAAIMEIANAQSAMKMKELMKTLQPIMEQNEIVKHNQNVRDAIKRFSENGHEDFPEYKDDMISFLKNGEYRMDDPEAYEKAYSFAKINKLEQLNKQLTETQGRTLVDYMGDDESLSKMASNEKVRDMVINEYLKGLSEGGKPQVISGESGNRTVASGRAKIHSINDAGKLFKKML